MSEIEQILEALVALEAQRGVLGDEIVETTMSSLQARLEALGVETRDEIAQRKLLTILFADLVGSTRIAQHLDPEDVMEIMDRVMQAMAENVLRHGGTVVRYMGDGIMAVFGLERSRENDPELAICAGLDMQESIHNYSKTLNESWGISALTIRVGINTGIVAIGRDAAGEKNIMGNPVNIASRLENAAPPGGLLISHATYRHIRGKFDVHKQPLLDVKGADQPLQTYLVTGVRAHISPISTRGVEGLKTPFVGRQKQMEMLRSIFHEAAECQQAQWVSLIGEPGVGKSRLAFEFSQWVHVNFEHIILLEAHASQQTKNMPYGLLRSMFTTFLDIQDSDSMHEVEYKIKQGISTFLVDKGAYKAHFIGILLGFHFPTNPYLRGALQDFQQTQMRGKLYLTQYLTALLDQSPALFILDDLQWADNLSLNFFHKFLQEHPNAPLMLIGLARPSFLDDYPEWALGESKTSIPIMCHNLTPLSNQESCQLVSEMFFNEVVIPDSLCKLIETNAEGNPYYLEEIINILLDDKIIEQDPLTGGWRLHESRLNEFRIPPTLTALLQSRLDNLSPMQRTALQQAAVIGRVFWDAILEDLYEDDDAPRNLLQSLVDRGLINHRPSSAFTRSSEFEFKHGLLRDVVYESIPRQLRRTYHAKIAFWLKAATQSSGREDEYAAVIAEHFELANEAHRSAAWYLRAGDRAKAQGAFNEAKRFYDHALQLNPEKDLERKWFILLGRDEVVGVLGDLEARKTDDETLLALAQEFGDNNRLAEVYFRKGYTLSITQDDQSALSMFDKALEAARLAGNLKLEAIVLGLRVSSLTRTGDLVSAKESAELALHLARKLEDEDVLARNLTNAAIYYTESGDISQAAKLLEQQVQISHQTGNQTGEAIGLGNLGYDYIQLGLYERGKSRLEQSIQILDNLGARRMSAYQKLNLSLALMRTGQISNSSEMLTIALAELERVGDLFGQAAALSYQGLLSEQIGEYLDAIGKFTIAKKLFEQIGARSYAMDAIAGLARCHAESGEAQSALNFANKLWDYLEAHGSSGLEFPIHAYLTCAQIYQVMGEQKRQQTAAQQGTMLLHNRASQISDPEWRQSFLHNIPEHSKILTLQR